MSLPATYLVQLRIFAEGRQHSTSRTSSTGVYVKTVVLFYHQQCSSIDVTLAAYVLYHSCLAQEVVDVFEWFPENVVSVSYCSITFF